MKTILRLFFPAAAALALSAVAFGADTPEAAVGKKININQASAAQIALLPRVGTKAAERIVEYRKAHGSFGQPEELMEVKGVGEKLFGELKPYVSLSGPTTLAAKVRAGSRTGRASGGSGRGSSAKKTASNSVPVGKGR
ncbi:MAG: helix-hairpin-helix domain-containing protein [Acidobacteria bacterium]|nr:helix-hairpin-helix domain-containing protein [Acidobacteriota bacterium]MCA1611052.1 helix-hairpin-helix domain-containing protein [Acidobacteriota bacterium]